MVIRENLSAENRGNFIDFCFLLEKFNFIILEHVTCFGSGKKVNYLGHDFQNEMIYERANLRQMIIDKIKKAKSITPF